MSTTHITPFFRFYDGGSLLTVHTGQESPPKGGGIRNAISGFSYASRRRLMLLIASINRDAPLPLFTTSTYPFLFPEPAGAKRDLDVLERRLRREFPECSWIWKLEPQKRGAPHFHGLLWGVQLLDAMEWFPDNWYEIAGGGDILCLQWHRGELGNGNKHCVQEVRSWKGVWAYASKYLGKTFEVAGWAEKWTGRYWGVSGRKFLPIGNQVEVELQSRQDAYKMMRLQRRFSGIKKAGGHGLTIFCDANQWVEKLVLGVVNVGVKEKE